MKIGIVNRPNSFAKHWKAYLKDVALQFTTINPHAVDSINELRQLDYLFWHLDHFDSKDANEASHIIRALQNDVVTFPNCDELDYFDNKIRQIELFKENNIKHPLTQVSATKEDSIHHIESLRYPFVAKLKKGAGSDNVWLIRNKDQAQKHIEKSFTSGFSVFNSKRYLKKRFRNAKERTSLKEGISGIVGMIRNKKTARQHDREIGYTFFQEYIPNEGYDIRTVVINQEKVFSARRDAREDGWTASGSGIASYPNEHLEKDYIERSFEIAEKLHARCIAIDFIRHKHTKEIFAIEISPLYASYSMEPCTGYWDKKLNWHCDSRDPQWFLMDNVLKQFT